MYIRGTNRIYTALLRIFFKFNYLGKNVIISPSCEIDRKVAPYIYLGNNVSLGNDVWLNIPKTHFNDMSIRPLIKIGDGSAIGRRCMFTASNLIEIHQNVLFGPGVLIADHSHQFNDASKPIMSQGITEPGSVIIEDGSWFGYHSVVVSQKGRDIKIGRNTVVGANAVVTKSCPPNSVLVGNPANNIRCNPTL